MLPTLFEIGPITVNAWGFMLALAVIISIYGVGRLFEREGYDKEMVLDLTLLMVVAGVIGSRLAYVAVYEWQEFLNNPMVIFGFHEGGIAGLIWYGGLIGGFIPFAIYVWKKKLDFWKLLDMFPLEEVLVPIIELTLFDNNIQVMLESNVIEVSYKTVPTLIVIITPDCEAVTAAIAGKAYKVEKLEKSKYKVEIPDLKKSKYTLDVFESQNKIASKEFTVKSKGFAERDMF